MRLSKAQREMVRLKFGGLCAYCGHPLPDRWHADHLEPVVRELSFKDGRLVTSQSRCDRPQNHNIENMMPACPPCNISKHRMDLEQWRKWLAGHINSLNLYHPIYRLSKAYGLIEETGAPIVFHFERVAMAREEQQ